MMIDVRYVKKALRLLKSRQDFWAQHGDPNGSRVYTSAIQIVEAALHEDDQLLDQLDYYD